MDTRTVELRIEPSMERREPRGVVVHVQLLGLGKSMAWAAEGDWMEQPTTPDLVAMPGTTIGPVQTEALFRALEKAQVHPLPDHIWGIHGTTYRLELRAGLNSINFVWWHGLPDAWAALSGVVTALENIAEVCGVEV